MLLSHDGTIKRWIHYNLSLNSTSFCYSITNSFVWLFRVDGCLVVQYDCGIIWKCRYFVWVSSVHHFYHLINLTLRDSSWGVYIVDLPPLRLFNYPVLLPRPPLTLSGPVSTKERKLLPKAKILTWTPAVWCKKYLNRFRENASLATFIVDQHFTACRFEPESINILKYLQNNVHSASAGHFELSWRSPSCVRTTRTASCDRA